MFLISLDWCTCKKTFKVSLCKTKNIQKQCYIGPKQAHRGEIGHRLSIAVSLQYKHKSSTYNNSCRVYRRYSYDSCVGPIERSSSKELIYKCAFHLLLSIRWVGKKRTYLVTNHDNTIPPRRAELFLNEMSALSSLAHTIFGIVASQLHVFRQTEKCSY